MGKYVAVKILGVFVSTVSFRLQANKYVGHSISNYVDKHKELTARNIANSGATVALNALTVDIHETDPASNVPLYQGTYSYFFEREAEDATLGPTEVRVTSIARYENLRDTVIVLLTRPSFSRYAYFTDREGDIWFATGDTIHGPCHTNSYFQMSGQPVFWGKVTSTQIYSPSSPYRRYPSGITDPLFYGGTEWGVPKLTMPTEIPQEMIDAAQSGGLYFNNTHCWIIFQSDGTAKICAKNSSSEPTAGQYTTYNLSSINGVIYIHYPSTRPTVRVEGTVNGKASIGTRGSIWITANIVYASNPMVNPHSDDMLGMVAARDIIVKNNVLDQDRTIQSTIMTLNPTMASNTNFWVDRYSNDRYGRLHLLGGLIQSSRGAVGLVGTPTTRKGYLKDYHWDPRLQDMSPPFFPMLFVLRKIAWWD